MALYEIVYIARQEISENDVEKITEEFSKLLEKLKGKVLKTEYWGLRSYAYEIKKAKKGHYTLIGVDAPPEAIKELERNMRLHENVIRNLTVRVNQISREQSSTMQNNVENDFELKIDTN